MAHDFSNIPVEQWAIDKLIPYEANHKKHPAEHVKGLADSIKEYGVEHPIAVEEDGTIISGHGRRLALIELRKAFAPVRVFRGITKEQANKLRIAANKTTSNDYDTDVLIAEMKKLTEAGLDLDGMGFSPKEMDILMKDIGEIDLGTLSDDTVGDIEAHEAAISDAAKKADEAQIRLDKAFGFKTVPAEYARIINHFMGVAQANYPGASPFEAMGAQMQQVVDDAA